MRSVKYLHKLAEIGDATGIQRELQCGTPVNAKDEKGFTALIIAASWKQMNAVKYLIRCRATVDDVDLYGKTALTYAVNQASVEIVKFLIEHGRASPNARDNTGWTPFFLATQIKHVEMMTYLAARGADVNRRANDGSTALTNAVMVNQANIIQILISLKADTNTMFGENGQQCLNSCCEF